jgi:hypothetical protein
MLSLFLNLAFSKSISCLTKKGLNNIWIYKHCRLDSQIKLAKPVLNGAPYSENEQQHNKYHEELYIYTRVSKNNTCYVTYSK